MDPDVAADEEVRQMVRDIYVLTEHLEAAADEIAQRWDDLERVVRLREHRAAPVELAGNATADVLRRIAERMDEARQKPERRISG